jgi:collagen type IV alpha-3-binding protein
LDDCRFDIKVNDSVWYLRARTVEERQKWLDALSYEQRGSNGSGLNSGIIYSNQANLKRHGSMQSINSTVSLSMASNDSTYKGLNGLKEKLDEMETFKNILCKQIDTLQVYFDACVNSVAEGAFEPRNENVPSRDGGADSDDDEAAPPAYTSNTVDSRLKERIKNRVKDHAAMGLDFKSEAYTFKAMATGILHELTHCIEIMQQREDYWRGRVEKEKDSRRRLEDKYKQLSEEKKSKIIIAGPDFEEGPFCNANEEFLDAIDTMLDTLEEEEERVSFNLNLFQLYLPIFD